jgi:hypothetical protein
VPAGIADLAPVGIPLVPVLLYRRALLSTGPEVVIRALETLSCDVASFCSRCFSCRCQRWCAPCRPEIPLLQFCFAALLVSIFRFSPWLVLGGPEPLTNHFRLHPQVLVKFHTPLFHSYFLLICTLKHMCSIFTTQAAPPALVLTVPHMLGLRFALVVLSFDPG